MSSAANKLLRTVADELFTKESTGVYVAGKIHDRTFQVEYTNAAVGLGSINGSSNAIIGTFDDGSIYFVNGATIDAEPTVFSLVGCSAAFDWFDPETATWKNAEECPNMSLTDSGWKITLSPANAILFRPAAQS